MKRLLVVFALLAKCACLRPSVLEHNIYLAESVTLVSRTGAARCNPGNAGGWDSIQLSQGQWRHDSSGASISHRLVLPTGLRMQS